jgi:perosamine synthetase
VIYINLPKIGEEEIQAVVKVLQSGMLTSGLGAGAAVTAFEKGFSEISGAKHSVAMNTGTAALHAAIMAVGVKCGDEVILPSFTFVATAEAVALAGAKPVFADIDPKTYNLAPSAVEKALTSKTKAILPVDLYGYSADMKPMREIADKHGLALIEDAAQAHGLTYEGKPAGAFSDIACWSMYASKNIMTGEGGVATTNSDQLDETLRMVRTHGENKVKYTSLILGTNYRMSEIQAAIGNVQLTRLPDFIAKRRRNAEQLTSILKENGKLILPYESKDRLHSWYLYTARINGGTEEQRNKLLSDLKRKGIGAEAYYTNPIHQMPFYEQTYGATKLPETECAAKQVFSLPIHPGVTEEQIEFIGETVLSLLK